MGLGEVNGGLFQAGFEVLFGGLLAVEADHVVKRLLPSTPEIDGRKEIVFRLLDPITRGGLHT